MTKASTWAKEDIKESFQFILVQLIFTKYISFLTVLMEPDSMPTVSKSSDASGTLRRKKRAAPYVIYPEILIIVDYDSYL